MGVLFSPFYFLVFLFSLFSESCEKKIGRVIADLKDFGQDGFPNLLDSPLSTKFAPRFFSWVGLPGESLFPTELADRLDGVC